MRQAQLYKESAAGTERLTRRKAIRTIVSPARDEKDRARLTSRDLLDLYWFHRFMGKGSAHA